MKLCWDNLNKLIYSKGQWKQQTKGGYWRYFVYIDECPVCEESFLAERLNFRKGKIQFCDKSCRMKWQYKEGKIGNFSGSNNPMYGKTHTKESKSRISKTKIKTGVHRGSGNGKWKGGITALNHTIRTCVSYKNWRTDVFDRDGFICQECNQRGNELQAHHIKRFSIILDENNITTYEECLELKELWDVDNGITLCKQCHKDKHSAFFGRE